MGTSLPLTLPSFPGCTKSRRLLPSFTPARQSLTGGRVELSSGRVIGRDAGWPSLSAHGTARLGARVLPLAGSQEGPPRRTGWHCLSSPPLTSLRAQNGLGHRKANTKKVFSFLRNLGRLPFLTAHSQNSHTALACEGSPGRGVRGRKGGPKSP